MNISNLFRLNGSDVIKGVVVAVLSAVLTAIHNALAIHSLNFGAYDWNSILYVGVAAGIGYLTKNFLSDEEGKVLGAIG